MMAKVAIKKNELWRAIRAHCLECSGGERAEVAACEVRDCKLWAFRLGRPIGEGSAKP